MYALLAEVVQWRKESNLLNMMRYVPQFSVKCQNDYLQIKYGKSFSSNENHS